MHTRVWLCGGLALIFLAGATGTASARQRRAASDSQEVTLQTILAIEDDRASTRADLDVLLRALRGPLATRSITALGRLQRRDVITDLLPYLAQANTRGAAATALGLSLRGAPLDAIPHGQQERVVLDALMAAGDQELALPVPLALGAISRTLGRLPYEDPGSVRSAERFLRRVLEQPFPPLGDRPHGDAARGLESLVRLNRKIATPEADTIARLRSVARSLSPRREFVQRNALAALIAAQGVDADTLEVVFGQVDDEVRRLAVLSVSGSGSVVSDEERLGYIRKALSDSSYMVRLEGLRAWARRGVKGHGCQPFLDALGDKSSHVVLAALDLLGDACRDDESITVTLASEARTPRPQGSWQREVHAFVSLAKRDRDRAGISLLTLATHTTWQVRMYAARAAAILEDVPVLSRLASDENDNVAEATLAPLRRLAGADSDQHFIEILNRRTKKTLKVASARPYEVIRTAAAVLEKATPSAGLVSALTGALERISAEQCETSRDTRLALIARLSELGSPAQASAMTPLLKDIDPLVARAAADVITKWSGKIPEIETPSQKSSAIPTAEELAKTVRVVFEMDGGGKFDVALDSAAAPLTRTRFLSAARSGYYNGLTFHRVVPNFVVQGGSPGANEYCGDCPFMRDEVGGMHQRGTLGISTRGADTGDAQIFINLVDNPRLDLDYTVFARICSHLDVIDEIKEGDRIATVQILPPTPTCGG
jgi:peptidyl-prolyl cis-trans isomerase B (cyclophilin B)